ncbi:MAG: hypothetical protein CMF62_04205 [Magnetococcales bacterium]|nr:hypothetical protein [Magnetococcales bacterium]|tara:strand:- start:2761 stop:3336 length:576 start_codon:yes stop_codon:yes gene_type:complete
MKNEIVNYYKNNGDEVDNLDKCDYFRIKLLGKGAIVHDSHALISKDSYNFVSNYDWYYGVDGYAKCFRKKPTKTTCGRRGGKLHRMLMPRLPKGSGLVIDHINRNRLDNRLSNLRICTAKENSYNRTKPKNSTSKYKGVRKQKNGKFSANLSKDGEIYQIKDLETEVIAAKTYDTLAETYFGEYAGKNFQT